MQLKELQERVTPIVNVDIVVLKRVLEDGTKVPYYVMGHRNPKIRPTGHNCGRLFPWWRMKYDETPQEACYRILKKELPWVDAQLKKLITAVSDKGHDHRAYGISLYYLMEHTQWEAVLTESFDQLAWMNKWELSKRDNVYEVDVGIIDEIEATIRTMNSSQDELLVEVDKDNKEIGYIEKRTAHNTADRYHRAAHIMIFTSVGKVVLQQRSINKARRAGWRDMPWGHQAFGHTIEQTADQELMEEMGVKTELSLHRIGLYQDNKQLEYYYLYYGVCDGPFGFDKNEVEAVHEFDCQKLINGEYDDKYDILNHVKQYTQELRFVREPLHKNTLLKK